MELRHPAESMARGIPLHPVADSSSGGSKDDVLDHLTAFRHRQADAEIPDGYRAAAPDEDVTESLWLELALTGSFGFWLTLAMMVGWSLRRGEGAGQAGAKSAEHEFL
jgi:hypothetical protein